MNPSSSLKCGETERDLTTLSTNQKPVFGHVTAMLSSDWSRSDNVVMLTGDECLHDDQQMTSDHRHRDNFYSSWDQTCPL